MNESWPFTIKYHREWKISRHIKLFLIFPFGLKWLNLLGFSLNFRHFLNNRFNKRNICWCFFLRGTNCQLISLRPLLRQRRLFIWCCIILHSKCFGYGCTESVEACMGNLQKQISHSADPTKCFIVGQNIREFRFLWLVHKERKWSSLLCVHLCDDVSSSVYSGWWFFAWSALYEVLLCSRCARIFANVTFSPHLIHSKSSIQILSSCCNVCLDRIRRGRAIEGIRDPILGPEWRREKNPILFHLNT